MLLNTRTKWIPKPRTHRHCRATVVVQCLKVLGGGWVRQCSLGRILWGWGPAWQTCAWKKPVDSVFLQRDGFCLRPCGAVGSR